MEQFRIKGQQKLQGTIAVRGAKNHALKLIPATLLSEEPTTISNLPIIEDVLRLLEIVEELGGVVKRDGSTVTITPPARSNGEIHSELAPRIRASVVLVGPMLARYGHVELPHPGGDKIGNRPINYFIDGFTALGATVEETETATIFSAPDGLVGTEYFFPVKSTTCTETMIMAATQASGRTVLRNAACEPEIVELAKYLNSVGAQITGAGTHTIIIEGNTTIAGGTAVVMPDRLETGTFMMLAAATRSDITITDCDPARIELPIRLLQQMGIPVTATQDTVHVAAYDGPIAPCDIVTKEYPGFPTDLQSPMTVLLTQAEGESSVRETIFDGRLFFTDMLNHLGADTELLDPYRLKINGPATFHGGTVESPDIRAGLAMIIAGLLADGETYIQNIYQIDRGYERIEERLQQIGADIERVDV